MQEILQENYTTSERILRIKRRVENNEITKPVKKDIFAFSYYKYRNELPLIQQAKALVNTWLLSPAVIESDELIAGGIYLDQMIKLDYRSRIRPSWAPVILNQKSDEVMIEGVNWQELDADWEVIFDGDKKIIEYFKKIISNPISSYQEYIPLEYLESKGFRGIPTCLGTITAGTVHLTGDYSVLLSIGIDGIKKAIRESLVNHKGDSDKEEFLESLLVLCDGIINYARLYSRKARDLSVEEKDPNRKEELLKLSRICSKVPEYPAEDFYEAIQTIFFVQILEGLGGKNLDSPGRFDQYMYPYYRMTIDKSIMSNEEIQELIDAFWLKCDRFKIWNIALGGLTVQEGDACNELTQMCLSSIERLHTRMPNTSFRWSSKTPDSIFEYVAKILSTGTALPALYNDEVIVRALEKAGIPKEDALNYCMGGCNNIHISGKSNFGCPDADKFSVAKPLEWALFNGMCLYHNRREGLETGMPSEFKNFDDFLKAYKMQLIYALKWATNSCNILQEYRSKNLPRLYKSIFIHDCIERACSIDDHGARYNNGTFWLIGFANVADSLAAIKKAVFEEKILTMEELCKNLKNNFKDNERLRYYLLNKCPKFGNNDPYVDDIAIEVTGFCFQEFKKIAAWRGGHYLGQVAVMFRNIELGREFSATPDGRYAGSPLANSIGGQDGFDKEGVTALLNSVSKLPQIEAPCGTILNLRFIKNNLKNYKAIKSLSSLFKQYFLQGGQQLQVTVVNSEELRDAQVHPEKYRDLYIKVGGYVERFVNLSKEQQESILKRTEICL